MAFKANSSYFGHFTVTVDPKWHKWHISRGKIFTLNFSVLGLFCQFLRPTAKFSGRFTAPIKILRGLMFLSRPKKLPCIIKPTNIDQWRGSQFWFEVTISFNLMVAKNLPMHPERGESTSGTSLTQHMISMPCVSVSPRWRFGCGLTSVGNHKIRGTVNDRNSMRSPKSSSNRNYTFKFRCN